MNIVSAGAETITRLGASGSFQAIGNSFGLIGEKLAPITQVIWGIAAAIFNKIAQLFGFHATLIAKRTSAAPMTGPSRCPVMQLTALARSLF